MTARPAKLPRWATDGGTVVEPPEGEKDTGWVPNFKPPARKQNWLHNTAYTWLDYVRAVFVSLSVFNWIAGDIPQAITLSGVAYDAGGGTFDKWVAVGAADGSDAHIAVSNSGFSFGLASANPKNFGLLAIASDGTNWVAVGSADGTDAYIVRKALGADVAWSEQTNPKNFTLRGIAYDGSGLFVAVGDADGTDPYIVSSPDGAAWTERAVTAPKNFDLNDVAHDGIGLFVAVGDADGADAYIVTSPDGITWTERGNPKNLDLNGVVWAPHLSLWIAVGDTEPGVPDAYLVTSPDGINWTERATPVNPAGLNYDLQAVATDGTDYVVAVGREIASGPTILVSADGLDWSTIVGVSVGITRLRGIAYDPDKSMWVAVGDGGQIVNTFAIPATVPA